MTLMKYKKTLITRMIFSMIVPMTVLAFGLADLTFDNNVISVLTNYTPIDFIAIPLCGMGVILYNFVEEPPQKVIIEKF